MKSSTGALAAGLMTNFVSLVVLHAFLSQRGGAVICARRVDDRARTADNRSPYLSPRHPPLPTGQLGGSGHPLREEIDDPTRLERSVRAGSANVVSVIPLAHLGPIPRSDSRMVKVLAQFGLDGYAEPVSVTVDSPLTERLAFADMMEEGTGER